MSAKLPFDCWDGRLSIRLTAILPNWAPMTIAPPPSTTAEDWTTRGDRAPGAVATLSGDPREEGRRGAGGGRVWIWLLAEGREAGKALSVERNVWLWLLGTDIWREEALLIEVGGLLFMVLPTCWDDAAMFLFLYKIVAAPAPSVPVAIASGDACRAGLYSWFIISLRADPIHTLPPFREAVSPISAGWMVGGENTDMKLRSMTLPTLY